jgi:hypothetical protein
MRTCKALCVGVLALAAASGCVVSFDGWSGSTSTLWGQDVEERDGHLVVDDVRLDHDRWEEVELSTLDLRGLTFGTASGPLRLTGDDGASARLRVRIHSEHHDDGTVVFEEGRLVARSDRGVAFINGIEGTIPRALPLTVATGTGRIVLEGVASGVALDISTGTGDVELEDVAASRFELESGTGDVRACGGGAETLVASTGTGDVLLMAGQWGSIRMETGTGDLRLTGCETGSVRLESGTGDLVLEGGRCGDAHLESGTGDLVLRDADVASHSAR